ncbi:alpha/beta hydrolase [Sphingomonas oligophenolica]|uniref:Proline iminopeptidase n=1 Tax=Sphingomonas oligophenolica TaxID=301154 RepID=A0ABU9YAR0_9SPHN
MILVWILLAIALPVVAVMLGRRGLQGVVAGRRRLPGEHAIDELTTWQIGGVPQAVQLRGNDARNPLLLYLHGGPGMPAMPFAHAFQRDWEDQLTVVHWDQRNAGKTLALNGTEPGLDLACYVTDGLEIARSLAARFPGQPIALLGQSWGSAIAVEMLRAAPDLFAGYMAIGQVSDFLCAERYGYETVLAEAQRRGDERSIATLTAHADYPANGSLTKASLGAVRGAEMKLGFGHHTKPNIMLKMLGTAFASPDYRWRDLLTFFNGHAQAVSVDIALAELPRFIGRARGARIACPVVMVGGEYDLFTPTRMAREFFDTIEAPYKKFVEVPGMAHFGVNEKPAVIRRALFETLLPAVNRHVLAEGGHPSHQ